MNIKNLKINPVFLSLVLFVTITFAQNSGIHGNIQLQATKTIWGTDNNFDQLFGRVNLIWAFNEDTTFSSLIQVRAYPAGFGYEKLIGASYLPEDTVPAKVPVVARKDPPNNDLLTLQIYQAWIRYKFPDFDIRVGRVVSEDTKSLHFGNYLDCPPGGTFTLSRAGIHNAVEGYKVFGPFDTKVHLGLTDVLGNRGFLRVYETLRPTDNFGIGIGYRANIFDLVHYDFNDSNTNLIHRFALSIDQKINPDLSIYLESSLSHARVGENQDPVPVLVSLNYTLPSRLKSFLKEKFKIPDLLDVFRAEYEYLYNRKSFDGSYKGIDKDFLWNVYGEKTWLKRMHFQGGLFAAPTKKRAYNVGFGLRFTSEIN